MATYNNKHWLLSHVRNSFISTDDTGLCEMVMLGEDLPRQLHAKYKEDNKNEEKNADYFCYPGFEESEDEEADILAQSYDLQFDMDFGHRLRSNTAQRLEKMDIAKKKAAKIKTIKWEQDCEAKFTDEEKTNFFYKKVVESKNKSKFKSKFSEQFKSCADMPMNQFINFGGVDGTAQFGINTKLFYIFLTMLSGDLRDYPMPVTVIATASIGELIGLICYKCSIANPSVCLKPVQYYALYITEDDGEVDSDFPSLDPREPCSKFGFKYLGLVEHRQPRRDMLALFLHKDSTLKYDNKTLNVQGNNVKEQNKVEVKLEDLARMKGHTNQIEAPLYRCYRVQALSAVWTKYEVQLGISGEKVEIDPVQQKKSILWPRHPKAVSYNMDCIASCEILEQKTSKSTFRILYSLTHSNTQFPCHSFDTSPGRLLQNSASFKHHDFECETSTAQEIVAKINNILEVHSSSSRREFLSRMGHEKSRSSIRTLRRSFNLSHALKF